MNENQRAKWERTRSRGMWRFVLLYGVVLWGGLMIVAVSAYSMITGTFVSSNLKITVPVFLVAGLVFGLAVWFVGEAMYRKSSGSRV